MDGIVKSISFLSGQYDDLLKKVAKLEEEKKVLAQDYASLKDKTFKIANELQIKKDCCDNMDVWTVYPEDCLEIRGIPVQQGEDTNDIIIKLGSKIGVEVNKNDISVSHRLPLGGKAARSDTVYPTIVVKFVRRDVRERYYRARKELKHLTTRNIFGRTSLTVLNRY